MTRRVAPAGKTAAERRDLHAELTAKIVGDIEAGAGEFQMPWHRPGVAFTIPRNALTGAHYRGSNILWLWMAADERKFEHQVFATYRQWQQLGAQVRGGEKGALIVKYGEFIPKQDREKAAEQGDDEDAAKRLYAKPAFVFNIDQVQAPVELRAKLLPADLPRPDLTVRLAHVEAFLANTKAEFREGGQRAFYRHRSADGEGDYIQMPPRNLFTGTATSTPTESYESTRLHECSHWAHVPHRMNVEQRSAHFGDHGYAYNELCAEISAAFLCAELEITCVPRLDHAQYVQSWVKCLNGDTKAIFTAAAIASNTVDFLMALQPEPPGSARPAADDPPAPGDPR